MAIQTDLGTTVYGTPFAGAYFRIVTAAVTRRRQGSEHKFMTMLDVAGYATSTPEDDTRPVDARRYHVPLDDIEAQQGIEFLAKCYAWVMQQEDMSGAQQV